MIESVPEKVAHITTVTGGATAVVGWHLNEYLALGGFIIALMSFAVNLLYKHRHYKLQLEIRKEASD